MNDSEKERCFHNRYHPTKPPCGKPGRPVTRKLGNATDNFLWCDEHDPQTHTCETQP